MFDLQKLYFKEFCYKTMNQPISDLKLQIFFCLKKRLFSLLEPNEGLKL